MNEHDQCRKNALVKMLLKSWDQAVIARMYLTANERDPEDIANANLAMEHIEIALGHLGVVVPQ